MTPQMATAEDNSEIRISGRKLASIRQDETDSPSFQSKGFIEVRAL